MVFIKIVYLRVRVYIFVKAEYLVRELWAENTLRNTQKGFA